MMHANGQGGMEFGQLKNVHLELSTQMQLQPDQASGSSGFKTSHRRLVIRHGNTA